MTERLFVYGTLAPGQPNEHVLRGIDGSREEASVRGTLHSEGWGYQRVSVLAHRSSGERVEAQVYALEGAAAPSPRSEGP